MIRLNNLSYHLPQGYLYKNISMFIDKGHKIGLTGKNGAGKSTLLRLISGEIKPTEGNVVKQKDLNIGYLTQDIIIQKNISIRSYIETSNERVNFLTERLEQVNEGLISRTDYESDGYMDLINEVTEINEELNLLDAHQFAERIESVLKGLGFHPDDFDKDIGSFSGGWQMRAELAKLLVNNPDILLIDEPTNHLDIVSIQWLEDYLKNYKGGLVLISHDKRFLDNVTNRTIEVANQKIYDYKCNYSKYLVLHAEALERTMQTKKNQDKEIERTQALISKYRAKANKAAFAQSLIKKLDKMEIIEVDSIERKAFSVKFPVTQASGKIVMDIKNLSKVYGEKTIFQDMDLLLARNEKIALLGPNGVGKSTFLKALTKEIEYEGNIEFGHNVKIGYFAQDSAEKLDPNKTVFQIIDDIAEGDKRGDIRATLGAFLFGGDDIDKKVSVLSGGERTRLAICKLLFYDFNFLILDEPTNHLDLTSKDILKEALKSYEGTLLLVSHDRDFLNGLSNKIWEIKDYKLKTHLFGVNEFLERIGEETYDNQDIALIQGKQEDKAVPEEKKVNPGVNQEIKKLDTKIKNAERKITELEEAKAKALTELESTDFNEAAVYTTALKKYESAEQELKDAEEKWEALELELETIQASL
ncbi:ABC transporter ATP-binding protein [Putridiphycobacter roseus]|uniref:Probable ATP-binding protein YbiT n=2 Tax=Putridiphycobacter roseus TaxID=2219161 RepID=A0A2W1NFQ6_9FLAO|nr:ABC-F family ATP-binding cassette domain-containing protein [Putridiphycobacter roseus]PZE18315.1 ABC transporter ATP-binding protein [Putridiphycobacter roseus]